MIGSQIRHAVRRALWLASLATAASGIAAAAENNTLNEVIVTGSRLAQTNTEAPTPITTLTSDDLLSTGTNSIGDILNDLPAMRGTYTTANSTRFIGTAGVNFLDLRGLGTERTLVLVNGRRHVAGTDGSLQVDINTIPTDLLDRVDIVTGGASSIYGSDAIAGVVNFILKQNYEGLAIKGQTGISSRSDNQSSFVSVTAGQNLADGAGNIAFSMEWAKEESFQMADRPTTKNRKLFVQTTSDPTGVSSDGIPDRQLFDDVRSLYVNEGGVFIPSFQPGVTTTNLPVAPRSRPSNGQPRVFLFNPDGSLGELDYGTIDFRPIASSSQGGNGSSLRRYGDLSPEIQRAAFNVLGHYDFTDSLQLFAEATYVMTKTLALTSPSFNQTVNTTAPSSNGSGALVMSLSNPYLTTQARTLITSMLRPGVTTFNLNRNNLDLGIRGEDSDRRTMRFVVGIRGELAENLSYEASVNYGQFDIDTNVLGNRYEDRLRFSADAALAANGTIVCRARLNGVGAIVTTGNAVIDSCVPANFFGDGNVSAAARDYITAPSTFEAQVKETVGNAYIAYTTAKFFEFQGGAPGVSLGAEYRKETSASSYSDDVTSGATFLNAIQPLDKDYSVKEEFMELNFPFLKGAKGADALELTASYRVADYDLQNTSSITAWGTGIQYAPVHDIKFRASLSQSVRAPTLGDLFQPNTQNFATVRDPCDVNFVSQGSPTRAANCAAAGIPANFANTVARTQTIEIRSGGNPGLTEEKSRSITLGVVLEPRLIPNLSVTVDYYDIQIDKVINSVTAQQILDNCYDAPSLSNIYCPLVFRDPATNLFYANGNGPIGGGVLQSTLNYAARVARGIDMEVSYRFSVDGVGNFKTRFLGTYVKQRDNFPFLSEPTRADRQLEELGDPVRTFALNIDYERSAFKFDYEMRYIDRQYVDLIENIRSVSGMPPQNADYSDFSYVGSVLYHNIRGGYSITDNLDAYLGVDNVTDILPPLGLTGTGAGSSIYSNKGRYYYAGVKWKVM